MRKQSKAYFMITVFSLLAILLTSFPISATNTEAETQSYHSSLITHWDFEGEGAEIYADKATSGTSADTLTATGDSIVVNDGVAYISDTAGNYLSATGTEDTDLYDFKNKTIVVKAALENTNGRGSVAGFISKQSAFTYFLGNESSGNLSNMHIRVNNDNNQLAGEATVMEEFRVFAMVMEYDEAANTLTAKYYMSTKEVPESAADFQLMVEQTVEITTEDTVVTSDKDLILGRRYDHTADARNLRSYFDDVKVYSDVLTLDEIAADCPEATDYRLDRLIVHWDFEGEGDTALANKAPNQTETEDAVIALNGTASVQNGVATLDATAGGYMTASTIGTLRDTTLVMKLKNSYIEGSTGTNTPIFNMGDTYFRYGAATDADSDGVYDGAFAIRTYAITEGTTNSKYRVTNGNFGSYSTDDGYQYLVCSFQYDVTTAKFIEKYYLSNDAYPDDVNDFTLITSTEKTDDANLDPASYLISASGLQLGGASAMQFGLEYDDIKIYKGAMTIDEVAATITTPKYRGVQIAENTDAFDIRFVATAESMLVSELGFDIIATYNTSSTKDLSKNCTTVYKTLNGNDAGTLLTYSAEDDFNSQYIMALAVTDVPNSLLADGGKVEFEVVPYSVINGLKISLETIVVTVVTDADGVTDSDRSATYDLSIVRKVNA